MKMRMMLQEERTSPKISNDGLAQVHSKQGVRRNIWVTSIIFSLLSLCYLLMMNLPMVSIRSAAGFPSRMWAVAVG